MAKEESHEEKNVALGGCLGNGRWVCFFCLAKQCYDPYHKGPVGSCTSSRRMLNGTPSQRCTRVDAVLYLGRRIQLLV